MPSPPHDVAIYSLAEVDLKDMRISAIQRNEGAPYVGVGFDGVLGAFLCRLSR